jgi:ribosome-binding ATPase YchF (GTP1/OBG family)
MQTGIVGLPQVGKTTLFRILTRAHLDEKSARGATHIGVARVPEPRIDQLAELYKPRKVTYATVEYVDVGGIQRDRARDSAILAPLRQVDALAHVLRVFDDPAVPHPAGSIDPLRDAQSLDLELMLSDLEQIERRMERVEKDLKKKKDTVGEQELALLARCRLSIESETPLRELEFTAEERKMLTGFMFLSLRPMLYVLNLGDDEVDKMYTAVERHGLESCAPAHKAPWSRSAGVSKPSSPNSTMPRPPSFWGLTD